MIEGLRLTMTGEELRARLDELAYIREHIEGGEVYRLDEMDLEFGEILPPKPGMVEQNDDEQENRVGFSLERIAKAIRRSRFDPYELLALQQAATESAGAPKARRANRAGAKPTTA